MTIRIAIVDDHPMFRQGVVAALESVPGFEVFAEGGSGSEALALCCAASPPNVLLLDLCMAEGGHAMVGEIYRRCPTVGIIVLTASESDDDIENALEAGARGYLLKGIGSRELIETIKCVHAGQTYVHPTIAARLLSKMRHRLRAERSNPPDALTPRESEILAEVGRGLTNKEVASSLGITEKTVKHYMTNIMQKLQVRNRVEAVLVARSKGTADPASVRWG